MSNETDMFVNIDVCKSLAGLKITADRSTVKMAGQLDFSSIKICS